MAVPHARPGEVVDLKPLGEGLRNAPTTAIVKSDAFEAVRLVVLAGREIPPHQVPGPITLHCLEGRVLLGPNDSTMELAAGQWVYLDGGARHSVKGIENSSLLLMILFDPREGAEDQSGSAATLELTQGRTKYGFHDLSSFPPSFLQRCALWLMSLAWLLSRHYQVEIESCLADPVQQAHRPRPPTCSWPDA